MQRSSSGSRVSAARSRSTSKTKPTSSADLPEFAGRPITLRFAPALTASRGRLHSGRGVGVEVLAGSFLRRREIVLDTSLRKRPAELRRIYLHELFHFVWLRLGNPLRRSFEELLRREAEARARGELGWSAEWRKRELREYDGRRWREYCCESFCDTAAWVFCGCPSHDEVTLPPRWRRVRERWMRSELPSPLPI